LSWRLAPLLAAHGVDAVHVREIGLAHEPDHTVMAAAVSQRRALVTCDGDFGAMLKATRGARPSVVLFRSQLYDRPVDQAPLLIAALRAHLDAIVEGALVVVTDDGSRVRPLPLGTG
jgi:predicted nuclease of predicted toxin-antitoxin system